MGRTMMPSNTNNMYELKPEYRHLTLQKKLLLESDYNKLTQDVKGLYRKQEESYSSYSPYSSNDDSDDSITNTIIDLGSSLLDSFGSSDSSSSFDSGSDFGGFGGGDGGGGGASSDW